MKNRAPWIVLSCTLLLSTFSWAAWAEGPLLGANATEKNAYETLEDAFQNGSTAALSDLTPATAGRTSRKCVRVETTSPTQAISMKTVPTLFEVQLKEGSPDNGPLLPGKPGEWVKVMLFAFHPVSSAALDAVRDWVPLASAHLQADTDALEETWKDSGHDISMSARVYQNYLIIRWNLDQIPFQYGYCWE